MLLEDIPRIINPSLTSNELHPTGISTRLLFSELFALLESTIDLAIIINPTVDNPLSRIRIAGIGSVVSRGQAGQKSVNWAYYVPQSDEELSLYEKSFHVIFSPQMRQIALCLNGSPDNSIFPYIVPFNSMYKGDLIPLYKDDIAVPSELLAKMQKFVVINETLDGDSQGFFLNDYRKEIDFVFYHWMHKSNQFVFWASEFVEALDKLLIFGNNNIK